VKQKDWAQYVMYRGRQYLIDDRTSREAFVYVREGAYGQTKSGKKRFPRWREVPRDSCTYTAVLNKLKQLGSRAALPDDGPTAAG
jgi:hypothetical protein